MLVGRMLVMASSPTRARDLLPRVGEERKRGIRRVEICIKPGFRYETRRSPQLLQITPPLNPRVNISPLPIVDSRVDLKGDELGSRLRRVDVRVQD